MAEQPGSQFWGTGCALRALRSLPDRAATALAKLGKKDQAKKMAADKKIELAMLATRNEKIKEKGAI